MIIWAPTISKYRLVLTTVPFEVIFEFWVRLPLASKEIVTSTSWKEHSISIKRIIKMIGTNPYLVIRKTLGMGNATVQKLGVNILQLFMVFKLIDSIFDLESSTNQQKWKVSLKTWLSFESSFDTIILCFKFKVDVHHGGDLTGDPSLTQSFHDLKWHWTWTVKNVEVLLTASIFSALTCFHFPSNFSACALVIFYVFFFKNSFRKFLRISLEKFVYKGFSRWMTLKCGKWQLYLNKCNKIVYIWYYTAARAGSQKDEKCNFWFFN